ncbi:hypothetical protein [Ilumatobacter coccineus]|uniref:Uncharacterized protein n=1 Tax=Ilumatobacter coccineus (strain NBRC 103263 / KCTC 29153 / YM16-304) TaxID=1313172 RepID=A0A6C7EAE7_ILUCY|nr:hypothetical protein [Ilumatobacter coccineus]BAN03360.1 hypothetical protein YM304_30460 [Ilumatobacter coccineus YM16-304]
MTRRNVSLGRKNTAIINGEVDLSTWALDELIRGRQRDKNGNWGGRDPVVYPANIYHELKARLFVEADRALAEHVLPAIHELARIARGDGEPAKPGQVQACEMILRYSIGAASAAHVLERITEAGEPAAWEAAITAGIVALPDETGVIDTTARTIPRQPGEREWWHDDEPEQTPKKKTPVKPKRAKS